MMHFGQTPGTNGGQAATAAASTTKEIPYDHVAVFKLQGDPGNRVEEVINISVDGAFVATAVGYSFIPARFPGCPVVPPAPPLRSNALLSYIFTNSIDEAVLDPRLFFSQVVSCLMRSVCPVDFRYSIIDSGSGRELQNRSIHNIAGLGEPNGERPFRPFAKPVLFQPRSTIRIVVEEISEGVLFGYPDPTTGQRVTSELNIVLHGYKMLGYGTGTT